MMIKAYFQVIAPEKQYLNNLQEISIPEYLSIILFIQFTPYYILTGITYYISLIRI